MAERCKPFEHAPPDGVGGWFKFQLRLLLDFQFRTYHHDLKGFLSHVKGKVLDLGCGRSPFKHLLNSAQTEFIGLDVYESSHFGYRETNVIRFDGEIIPFPDGSIDCVICTEVLEHVQNPKQLVDEIYRVLKPGGSGIITVPWSARMHYFPYDYLRFTSFFLEDMFGQFATTIAARGTDITTIVSKIIIVYLRNFQMSKNVLLGALRLLFIVIFSPFMAVTVLIGHLSLILHWGSPDDPLGWTIFLQKKVV